ncbi:DUF4280 domain-containing protein [Nocardia sp. CDC159]|uniref:DUF4280 domain-containing protein n=1 Tax=Nocardia pulmonis TaxID=2951408 RepID=A0A9X2IUD7_9NOCA|nr:MULTISPECIES: DUF4280 domain-containing protein [Nocardia]MCM6771968.1 DUF4280 domain-containing protein [Nocardia pulmonis]MCM6785374.1 DUF4280 domain-containing protein [Nocardia sp. CDC159]
MAKVVVVGAQLVCGHGPIAVSSNSILTVGGHPVLVRTDLPKADFKACTAATPPGKCTTLGPLTAGVSTVLKVGGQPVVLQTAAAVIAPGGKLGVPDPGQTILEAR